MPFFIALPIAAPAGIPADRLKALQDGFMEMAGDQAFLDDATKIHFEVDPISGAAGRSHCESGERLRRTSWRNSKPWCRSEAGPFQLVTSSPHRSEIAMAGLRLSFACGPYDRTQALRDETIRPEGIELKYIAGQPAELSGECCSTRSSTFPKCRCRIISASSVPATRRASPFRFFCHASFVTDYHLRQHQ